MSDECRWLHEQLKKLPLLRYPLQLDDLPLNGIYFFYEQGEIWRHGGQEPRIVRIGTSKNGNFRSRIKEHFLLDESKMNFDSMRPGPRERSIFRKNLGRALLNKNNDDYLETWEIDFTSRENRDRYSALRDIAKEKRIESEVTRLLRENFSFRYIIVDNQESRMGSQGLEHSLIGTIAKCGQCHPSDSWLGNYSPKEKIRDSGLWLEQGLSAASINENDKTTVLKAIDNTLKWIEMQ